MSATYNWSKKAGSVLVYSIDNLTVTIAASADDVKPSNACYVALFGNDVTGNGSRMKPYRTFAKGMSVMSGAQVLVMGSGVYRERYAGVTGGVIIVGDGNVILDGTTLTNPCAASQQWENITIKNYNGVIGNNSGFKYCTVTDIANGWDFGGNCSVIFSTFARINSNGTSQLLFPRPTIINGFYNNTFIDCVSIGLISVSTKHCYLKCIFYRCNIVVNQATGLTFSSFYQCNFKFTTGSYAANIPTTIYPTVPATYAYLTTIAAVRAAQVTAFGTLLSNLDGCDVLDPLFNNFANGDYSLSFGSPVKNMSNLGTFIGSKSIAYQIKADATESDGDFDFSTAVNVTVADNSIIMTDDNLLSVIETNCKPNLIQRAFNKVSIIGFNSDRNGQYIDSIADLSGSTISAGTNLVANTPYLVGVASITYNGAVIQAGERFTTTSVLSFTSAGGGVCREILEAPERHTIQARFGDGGATKVVGNALTAGYWYYVTGTITYNSVAYTDRTFKAVDTNSFTGSGIVIEALTTEVYQHYELGIAFTSNNVGDVRTGAIVRGNGDPAYERGTTKEFPINARFIQIKYIIQPNNLRP